MVIKGNNQYREGVEKKSGNNIKNEIFEKVITDDGWDLVKVLFSDRRKRIMSTEKYLECIERYKKRIVAEIEKQKR